MLDLMGGDRRGKEIKFQVDRKNQEEEDNWNRARSLLLSAANRPS
jgi:hypothetical protein